MRGVYDVRPVYPDDAKTAGVEGVTPPSTRWMQWRFEPALLNGEPVEVEMVVTINFTLSK